MTAANASDLSKDPVGSKAPASHAEDIRLAGRLEFPADTKDLPLIAPALDCDPDTADPRECHGQGISRAEVEARLRLYALDLASKAGFPVLPLFGLDGYGCCTCGNTTCSAPGKHPCTDHGKDDATTDTDLINAWWTKWPFANVGIVTGAGSGLVAIDVDPRNGGTETLRGLEEQNGKLPEGPKVFTGGGGLHLFFAHPGRPVKSKAGALGPGVDVKGDGGYVVAPPSIHVSGKPYEFDLASMKLLPPALPGWVLARIEASPAAAIASGPGIASGTRNSTLASLAGTMRRRGMSPEAIEAALLEENQQRCKPPLDEPEVRTIAASVSRYNPAKHLPSSAEPGWPAPLGLPAFHGLAGEIVHAIEPHTEADTTALLSQLLVHYGNAIGRKSYFIAEADRHYPNLFMVLVGVTSKGRKGTSAGHIRRLFSVAEPRWEQDRVMAGLSSGEGLIWAVHDKIEKLEAIKEKGIVKDYQTIITDPGIADKRLLALESEFSSVLKVLGREGNVLSAQLRQAWDTGMLRTLTKGSPARATDAHISVIGHITKEELLRELNSTEAANGFGNRFLWICSRRSKVLPEGGEVPAAAIQQLAGKLKDAITWAGTVTELRRDSVARGLWIQVYEGLSEGAPGLFGAVTSRAEAQTMRLALIYALLDRSKEIRREHLEAALAFWRYAEDSARFIFGDSIGDSTADTIIAALRAEPKGLTRSDIADLFAKHRSSSTIDNALRLLHRLGLANKVAEETAGRPIERWFASPTIAG